MPSMTQADYNAYEARRRIENHVLVNDDAVPAGEEGALHLNIEAELKRRRILYVHSRMDRATTVAKGVPDWILFPATKQAAFIECKTRTGKMSPDQIAWQMLAELAGYPFFVVRSMSQFLQVLKDLNL